MNKCIEVLEKMESLGFIKADNKGYIGNISFSEIEDAIESDAPWIELGYGSEATMNVMFKRELPGYKKARGISWINVIRGNAPKYKKIRGIGYNDLTENVSDDGQNKRFYTYYLRMLRTIERDNKFSLSEEWKLLSNFKRFFDDKDPLPGAIMKPSVKGLYSADTVVFTGGKNEQV